MVISTGSFLSNLIQTGPDAGLNLFAVSIKIHGSASYEDDLSFRITDAPSVVTRDSATTPLAYQNVNVDVLTSGTSITKTQQFTVRVDSDYSILSKLRSLQCIDSDGNYVKDESKKFSVTVEALKPDKGFMITAYKWKFNDCYLTSITPISYGYGSDGAATTNISFVWSTYEEGPEV